MAEAAFELRIGDRGRVVLPSKVRDRLGVREGDLLVGRVDTDGVLTLEPLAQGVRAARGRYRQAAAGRDLVLELSQERRREAGAEEHSRKRSRG